MTRVFTLKIDGEELSGRENETILEVARDHADQIAGVGDILQPVFTR